MANDIANIGLAYDPAGGKAAQAGLQALVPPAVAAQKAVDGTGAALDRVGASGASAASGTTAAQAALRNVAAGGSAASAALSNVASATGAIGPASFAASNGVTRLAEGYDVLTGKINGNFLAIGNNLQRLGLLNNDLGKVGKSFKFTATEGLNFSRQLADIGVTAAMGMSPLMIAIQQGPQLFDILQTSAQRAGVGVAAAARMAGASIYAAIAPLLPIILAIGAAIGVVAAAFGLATRKINEGSKSMTDGMGLTEKQLERVKKAGVDTSVTIGDTFFAFFDVVGDRLTSAFEGPLKWLADAWKSVLDFLTGAFYDFTKFLIGVWSGAVNSVINSWRLVPAAMGDIITQIANGTVTGIEWMINKTIGGINTLISAANAILGTSFDTIGDVSLGRFENKFEGAGAKFGGAFVDGFSDGFKGSGAAVDKFFDDVAGKARSRARKRITAAAGDAGPGAKTPKGPKTDAQKFSDIVGGVERDKAEIQAQINGLNMTADAAMRLTNEQKLLNEAAQKGITLTPQMTETLKRLAGELTDLQIQLRNGKLFKEIVDSNQDAMRALDQVASRIGVYGKSLLELSYYQEDLNKATNNGRLAIDDATDARLRAMASFRAEKQHNVDGAAMLEEMAKNTEDATFAMSRERGEIGLTGAALAAYTYETELLTQARARGQDQDAAVIAGIQATAAAYGEARAEVDNLRGRLDALNSVMGATGSIGKLLGSLTSNDPTSALLGMGGIGSIVGLMTSGGRESYQKQADTIAASISEVFGVGGAFAKTLAGALQGSSLGSLGGSVVGLNNGGSAIGGALGGALMSGGLGKSITKGLTGALGSALGGALSSAIPILGGIAGGLLGSLMKKDKWGSTTVSAGGSQGTFGNSGTARSGSSSIAATLNATLGKLATSLDATLGEFAVSIGVTNGKINVNPGAVSGMIGTTKQADTIDFGEDQAAALKYAIQNAISDGALAGLSEGVKNFLLYNPNDFEGQLQKVLNLKGAQDELSQRKDGQAFDLSALDKVFNELRDTAYRTGEGIADIEELYGLKRQDIIEQYASEAAETERARLGMEAELLRLSGDEIGALNIGRKLEREQIDASLRPLYDLVAAKQDEVAITEKAAEATRLLEEARKSELDRLLSLRERLLTAQGDDAGLRSLQRMLEFEKASLAEREGLTQIYAAEDKARAKEARDAAAARMAELAKGRTGYEIEILRALGMEEAALAKERALALQSVDPALQAMQKTVWYIQDTASELNATIDKFTEFGDSLREFRKGLYTSETGLSASYDKLRSDFLSVSAAAQSGDADAFGKVPGAGSAFLDAARGQASSKVQYLRDLALVARAVDASIASADEVVDYNKEQLTALQLLVTGQTTLNNAIIGALTIPLTPEQGSTAELRQSYAALEAKLERIAVAAEKSAKASDETNTKYLARWNDNDALAVREKN